MDKRKRIKKPSYIFHTQFGPIVTGIIPKKDLPFIAQYLFHEQVRCYSKLLNGKKEKTEE